MTINISFTDIPSNPFNLDSLQTHLPDLEKSDQEKPVSQTEITLYSLLTDANTTDKIETIHQILQWLSTLDTSIDTFDYEYEVAIALTALIHLIKKETLETSVLEKLYQGVTTSLQNLCYLYSNRPSSTLFFDYNNLSSLINLKFDTRSVIESLLEELTQSPTTFKCTKVRDRELMLYRLHPIFALVSHLPSFESKIAEPLYTNALKRINEQTCSYSVETLILLMYKFTDCVRLKTPLDLEYPDDLTTCTSEKIMGEKDFDKFARFSLSKLNATNNSLSFFLALLKIAPGKDLLTCIAKASTSDLLLLKHHIKLLPISIQDGLELATALYSNTKCSSQSVLLFASAMLSQLKSRTLPVRICHVLLNIISKHGAQKPDIANRIFEKLAQKHIDFHEVLYAHTFFEDFFYWKNRSDDCLLPNTLIKDIEKLLESANKVYIALGHQSPEKSLAEFTDIILQYLGYATINPKGKSFEEKAYYIQRINEAFEKFGPDNVARNNVLAASAFLVSGNKGLLQLIESASSGLIETVYKTYGNLLITRSDFHNYLKALQANKQNLKNKCTLIKPIVEKFSTTSFKLETLSTILALMKDHESDHSGVVEELVTTLSHIRYEFSSGLYDKNCILELEAFEKNQQIENALSNDVKIVVQEIKTILAQKGEPLIKAILDQIAEAAHSVPQGPVNIQLFYIKRFVDTLAIFHPSHDLCKTFKNVLVFQESQTKYLQELATGTNKEGSKIHMILQKVPRDVLPPSPDFFTKYITTISSHTNIATTLRLELVDSVVKIFSKTALDIETGIQLFRCIYKNDSQNKKTGINLLSQMSLMQWDFSKIDTSSLKSNIDTLFQQCRLALQQLEIRKNFPVITSSILQHLTQKDLMQKDSKYLSVVHDLFYEYARQSPQLIKIKQQQVFLEQQNTVHFKEKHPMKKWPQ